MTKISDTKEAPTNEQVLSMFIRCVRLLELVNAEGFKLTPRLAIEVENHVKQCQGVL